MLQLRPNCEACDKDLPPASDDALICTFECTFCKRCAVEKFRCICPNCGGNLVERPIRPVEALKANPASSKRIFKREGW
ncbi:DUF1272 domain-containing protein [Simiduia litorea]|uniref:DUF1272 domain-containing protein n=1 Tax=Simiduia litorea TaxID=1435348 RepID=UPI0036F22D1D